MLGQANFLPQKPRQVVVWKDWRNWRAETVPAKRTAATIAVRIVFLIVLLPMIRTFPLHLNEEKMDTSAIWPAVEIPSDATSKSPWLTPAGRRTRSRWHRAR